MNPHLLVYFRGSIASSDPECARLVEIVDGSEVFDVGRRALSSLRPRKKFDTDFGITVGSVRSNGGQYYIGVRDMATGVAKRDELIAKQRLGNYDRHYWGPPFALDVGFSLVGRRPNASSSLRFKDDEAERWSGEWSDALFELFTQLVSVREPLMARSSWFREHEDEFAYERMVDLSDKLDADRSIVPGTRWMLYLNPEAVMTLGGVERVWRDAPVLDISQISHGDRTGVACRLCRLPEELTRERLSAWREFLHPVLDLPHDRKYVRELRRPTDILPTDFDRYISIFDDSMVHFDGKNYSFDTEAADANPANPRLDQPQ